MLLQTNILLKVGGKMLGKLIGTGRTAEVYEWTDHRVIKLFYQHIKESEVYEEFNKHQFIENRIVLITKSYSVESINQRLGIVYDRVTGQSMTEKLMDGTALAYELGLCLGRTHKAIHQVKVPEISPMNDYLENLIESSKEITTIEKERLLNILSTLPNGDVLCHMDFHPDNVYIDGNNVKVLDWMTALKADPLADVARTMMILQYAEIPNVSDEERKTVESLRNDLLEGYKDAYDDCDSIDVERLNKWITVMLAMRLLENISENEKNVIKNVLYSNLKEYSEH